MPVRNPMEIHAAFEKAFNSGDLDGLVALYEKNAVLAAGLSRTVIGSDAIREACQNHLAMRTTMTLETGLARSPAIPRERQTQRNERCCWPPITTSQA